MEIINYMKRVVVSGATGAIGISLLHLLISRDIEVLVLTHKDSKRNEYIPTSPLLKIMECDMGDYNKLIIDEKFDIFYHMAWKDGGIRDDIYAQLDNIHYTLEAVKLAKRLGCKRFIGCGSQAEYGSTNEKLSPETPVNPQNAFGATKLYAGTISKILAEQIGIEHIWVRVLSIYGPFDGVNTMIISTLTSLLKHKEVAMTKCEQLWDYLYCSDAAEAFYLIAEKGIGGRVYCLGSGCALPLKEYVRVIQKAINTKNLVKIGERPYSKNQVMYLCADLSQLTKDTGFRPSTCFEDGINETIEWIKEYIL